MILASYFIDYLRFLHVLTYTQPCWGKWAPPDYVRHATCDIWQQHGQHTYTAIVLCNCFVVEIIISTYVCSCTCISKLCSRARNPVRVNIILLLCRYIGNILSSLIVTRPDKIGLIDKNTHVQFMVATHQLISRCYLNFTCFIGYFAYMGRV